MFRSRTSFIGRRDEVAALTDLFERGARLVTVLGPPGMGKTRLAHQLAAQTSSMPVHVCDLTPTRRLADVLAALAAVLQLPRDDERPPSDDVAPVAAALAARGPLLFLLDNFEHLVDLAAPVVGALLDAAPHARFLVTSRTRLRLDGEVSFDLQPLSRGAAVELFVERATLGRHGYALTALDRPIVEALVDQLDRMPLAIELAASRARLLTPRQLLDRLGRRLDLLQSKSRDADARHGSMRHAIDRSWEMLEPWEKEALAQASIFRGSFDVDSAESILDLGPEAPPVLEVLDALLEHSMLHVVIGDADEPTSRLAMYESIREYAADKLAAGGGEAALRTRHARWYTKRHVALCRQAGLVFDLAPASASAAPTTLTVPQSSPDAAYAALSLLSHNRHNHLANFEHSLWNLHCTLDELGVMAYLMADRALLAANAPRTLELGATVLSHPLFSRIPSVHGLLGLVYYASGAEEEAERAFARAAESGKIDLLTVKVTLGRSLLYISRGAIGQAQELLARATPALRPVCDAHAEALLEMFGAAAAAFGADFDAARAAIAVARERLAGSDEPELAALAGWIAALVDRLARGDDPARAATELGAIVLPDRHRVTTTAQRLLVEGLRARSGSGALSPPRPPRDGPTLHLAADGGWFELDMARVDLSRRETLKRILLALVARHRQRPGTPLTLDEVIAAGWPGEKILPEAGRQRAYTALSSLRDMGLRDILLRRADGYLLDPVLFVAWTQG